LKNSPVKPKSEKVALSPARVTEDVSEVVANSVPAPALATVEGTKKRSQKRAASASVGRDYSHVTYAGNLAARDRALESAFYHIYRG